MRGCSPDVWKGKNGPPREYIIYMTIPMVQVVPYFVTSCSTMKNLDMSAYLVIPVNERTCVRAHAHAHAHAYAQTGRWVKEGSKEEVLVEKTMRLSGTHE